MTDKDLLSINEAYAASQKAVKEPVNEAAPLVALGVGAAKAVGRAAAVGLAKKALKKKDTEEDTEKATEEVKCEHCNGTGKHGEQDCTKCKGTGIITINAAHCNEKATDQRPKDEVKADEISKDSGCDPIEDELQDPVEAEEKEKKTKKTANESINNSNKGNIMSEDKSIFDKLYESVMGEDEDFELGIPGDDDGLDMGDDAGSEEGGDVTVTLTADQADCLKAIIDQLGGHDDEDEAGDVGDDDPLADTEDENFQEDTTHTKDGSKPGHDPSDGGGKTTEPAADSLGGKSSGTGDASVTDEVDGGKDTGEGKKPGHAKNAGKPGSQAV